MFVTQVNGNHIWHLILTGISTAVVCTSSAYAQGAKPKFFICPQGMTRFATLVTTKHDVNVCGREEGEPTLLALRVRGKKRIFTVPVVSTTGSNYVARSSDGTVYTLDINQALLSIQSKQGRVSREKVIASD